MFALYGCAEPLQEELISKLSVANKQERYDQIQKICFYFSANATYLNKLSADVILNLPRSKLIIGSTIEAKEAQHKAKMLAYEILSQKQINSEHSLQCGKCGQPFECLARQLRGGDEGSTMFISCSRCNFRMKV
jgi:DNA-directed RNA polymerase subunit M/transcription elongation factor TFIIS